MSERVEWTPERIKREVSETCWNYQELAARTIPEYGNQESPLLHAMFGIVAEIQESYDAWDVLQRYLHDPEEDFSEDDLADISKHFYRELGDVCWMAAEMYSFIERDLRNDYAVIFEKADWMYIVYHERPYIFKANAMFNRLRSTSATLAADFQHVYQGRALPYEHLERLLISLYSDIAVLGCFVMEEQGQHGITPIAALDAVMQTNIVKLRKRYPGAGWDLSHDLNRAEDDT